jgi:Uma2 family endonuclease
MENPMSFAVPKRRFTVDETYRMAEAGILGPDERFELIDGELILKVSPGSKHAACVGRLTHIFVPAVGAGQTIRVQQPVRISDLTHPEPDLAIVEYRSDY